MPIKDFNRLQAVNRFLDLKIDRETQLDQIATLAAEICQTEVALITFLDEHTQHVRFAVGWDTGPMPIEDAFCPHTIQQDGVMIVQDALLDTRFVENRLVTNDPFVRFYAGANLTTHDQLRLGSLCVLDRSPKTLSDSQVKMLKVLSDQVIQILEFEMSIQALKDQYIATKNSEIKLRSFFEGNASFHLLLGSDYRVMAFNRCVKNFVINRLDSSIAEGDDIRNLIHEDHLVTFSQNYQAALRGQAVHQQINLGYGEDMLDWDITFEPAIDNDHKIIGVSLTSQEVTEKYRQQLQINAKNHALEKIAFVQSHEVRKPIATILGLMSLIRQEAYFNDHSELAMLDENVRQLDDQIKRIVSYTYA